MLTGDKQRRVYEYLRQEISIGADLYYSALVMLEQKLPAYKTLVSHCAREIISNITRKYKSNIPNEGQTPKLERFFATEIPDINKSLDTKQLAISLDSLYNTIFIKLAHLDKANDNYEKISDNDFLNAFNELESILLSIKSYTPFFDDKQIIDSSLDKLTKNSMERIKRLFHNRKLKIYFFNKADVEWLQLLIDANEFSDFKDAEFWVKLRYLEKVANKEPEKVFALLNKISNNPENISREFIIDFFNAVLALPAKYSAKYTKLISNKIVGNQDNNLIYFHEKFEKWIINLLDNNYTEQAICLLAALLKLRYRDKDGDEKYKSIYDLRSIDEYHYQIYFSRCYSLYYEKVKYPALELLIDILDQALNSMNLKYDKENKIQNDYSSFWRPYIERSQYNKGDIPIAILVDGIVEYLSKYIEGVLDSERLVEILKIIKDFEGKKKLIFKNFILFVIRKFGTYVPEIKEKVLVSEDYFFDYQIKYEYDLLLKQEYPVLSPTHKSKIIDYIKTGPNWISESNDEHKTSWLKRWQFEKLHIIKDFIDTEMLNKYSEIEKEFNYGKDYSVAPPVIESFWGPNSPKSIEDLSRYTVAELIEYLKTWEKSGEPKHNPMKPSPEGLARNLVTVFEQNIHKYINKIELFKDDKINKTYIRTLLDGLNNLNRNTIREKLESKEWEKIFDLIEWVLEKPKEKHEERQQEDFYQDQSWNHAKSLAADLFRNALEGYKDITLLPYSERIVVVLSSLFNKLDNDNFKWDKKDDNLIEESINYSKSRILHAVIALIKYLHINQTSEGEMPKNIFNILDEQLNTGDIIVRSVYAQEFSRLNLFISNWTKKNLVAIFPLENKEEFSVLWYSFLWANKAYKEDTSLLSPYYKKSLELLKPINPEKTPTSRRLVENLLEMYWRGWISLHKRPEDSLVFEDLYPATTEELHKYVVSYVGSLCRGIKEAVPENIQIKLKELINWRLKQIEADKNILIEFDNFIDWLVLGKIDYKWCISVLEILDQYPDFTLKNVYKSFSYIKDNILCFDEESSLWLLEFLARKANDRFSIEHEKEEIRFIINKLRSSENASKYKLKLNEIINIIGNIPWANTWDFEDLLIK